MYHLLSPHTCAQRTQFCPHCGSKNYKRHGSFYRHEDARRVQRFYCNACSKTLKRTDRLEDHLCVFIDDYNRFRQPKSGKEFVRQNDLGQQ